MCIIAAQHYNATLCKEALGGLANGAVMWNRRKVLMAVCGSWRKSPEPAEAYAFLLDRAKALWRFANGCVVASLAVSAK